MNSLVWSLSLLLCWSSSQLSASQKLTPQLIDDGPFQVVKIVDGLEHPWGMAFLPDGRILVTERPGRLRIVEQGRLDPQPISGLPSIAAEGQGGLLDVVLHPDYQNSGWLYLSYVTEGDGGMGTEVIRARLDGGQLKDTERLFTLDRKTTSGRHFGSRLVFDRQGYLYITVGERGDRPRAQNLDDQAGSVIRLHDDGRIPDDNPFVGSASGKPEIFSYGHRNPQGMALHPESGAVWSHEHGPQGGDEINIIHPGLNYGWPVITYGVNYGWGTQIGEGTEKPGMAQPLYYWVPSIAPSGMSFYHGDHFPQWRNSLFVGSLKFQQLVRLELAGERVVKEERFLSGKLGRIRDVRSGPDGYLYLLTDASNGGLYRLEPK
ncbi:MAG: PQQ-dependent sugar dehydrogenase [Gammaproteobacteria bacterium]|nr:PQQ-dependent sugar dehydrogenase [Gammaproteobacteria bacterium]